jgi:hypothetical protein
MATPNVGEIVSSTIQHRNKEYADDFTNNNAILFQMSRKGRIEPVDGGEKLYEEVAFAANSNAGSFDGYDTLPTTQQQVFDTAEYAWKQYAVAITMSGREKRQNMGSERMINLLASRIDNARGSLKNLWSTDAYGDGTGNNGKNLTGLNAFLPTDPTSGTVGGISRVNFTFWRSQIQTLTFATATILTKMNLLWVSCCRGTDKPQLILTDNVGYTTYESALQPNQRFTDAATAEAGFENYKYKSAPVVLDGGIGGACPASQMFFLNLDYLYWRPHTALNFAPMDEDEAGRQPVNQDAVIKYVGLMGNITARGLKFSGRFNGS